MKQVRCISPHGGMRGGDPLHGIPPAERGYVDNGVLGRVAVGDTVAAPDDFTCDGFHFEDVQPDPVRTPPAPAAAAGEGA